MAYPSDLKFFPTDESLVGYYLRNRVDTGKDGFITDIKLYEEEPWLLPHVNNDQFKEKNWFYFVVRTRQSGNRPNRTVPGRGGSNGGTWTSNSIKKEILVRNKKVVIGYKTELAYTKKVKGKTKGDTTGWCMTEYWLASENDSQFQEVVLCHLRDKNKNLNKIVADQLPERNNRDNNGMISNALASGVEGAELDSEFGLHNSNMFEGVGLGQQDMKRYADELESMLEEDKATQQQHQQQISLPPQRQEPGSINNPLVVMEDELVELKINNNGMISNALDYGVEGPELDSEFGLHHRNMFEGEGLGKQDMKIYADELESMLKEDDEATQEQQHPQIWFPPQHQDPGSINNPLVVMEDECVNMDVIFNLADQQADITQRKQDPYDGMPSTRLEMQNNLIYFRNSGLQEMSPWNNMMNTNPCGLVYNTHGYEMKDSPVSNGVNQDSCY